MRSKEKRKRATKRFLSVAVETAAAYQARASEQEHTNNMADESHEKQRQIFAN